MPHESSDHSAGLAANPPRSYLETFVALIRERRVSHGAFRLWHALRDYTDHASRCFPGQRRLITDIGCDRHSIRRWTGELIAANWLKIDGRKPGLGFTYTVMDGTGQPLRKTTTPTVAEKRNTGGVENRSGGVAENHNEPLRKSSAKVSSPVKSAHLSQGSNAPTQKLSTGERISFEKELDAITECRRTVKNGASHDATGAMYSDNERTQLRDLREREADIKKLLGRKY